MQCFLVSYSAKGCCDGPRIIFVKALAIFICLFDNMTDVFVSASCCERSCDSSIASFLVLSTSLKKSNSHRKVKALCSQALRGKAATTTQILTENYLKKCSQQGPLY